jgi:AcrR family transcriptional regulator
MAKRRRGRPSDRTSEETRSRILSAALYCFGELGYDAATYQRIAERAGVSAGAVYQHFARKRDLYVAVAEQHDEPFNAAFGSAVAVASNLSGVILQLIDVAHSFHVREPIRAQFIFARPLEIARHEELSGLPTGLRHRAAIRAAVERARKSNEIDPELTVDDAADALFALVTGMGLYGQAAPDLESYERMVRACRSVLMVTAPDRGRGRSSAPRANTSRRNAGSSAAPNSTSESPPTSSRERLVNAAIDSFAVSGYARTTIADIVRPTGLTTGALYGNFRSKLDLFEAAAERSMTVVEEQVRAAASASASLEERIMRYLGVFRDLANDHPTLAAFRSSLLIEIARNEDLRSRIGDELGRRMDLCRSVVTEGTDQISRDDMTLLVLAGADGLVTLSSWANEPLKGAVEAMHQLLMGSVFVQPRDLTSAVSR